jgi:aspartyl-tRNA(Asn)/glutamyl-tRNA(Gln) amidotransferase subunit C
MAKLTQKDVKKIADLIKIAIPDAELDHYTSQLNAVLDSVEVLKELDTEGVKPTSQTHGQTNIMRADKIKPGIDISKYQNRRNLKDNYFAVRKVL